MISWSELVAERFFSIAKNLIPKGGDKSIPLGQIGRWASISCCGYSFLRMLRNRYWTWTHVHNEIGASILHLFVFILIPRGRALFGQHQESRPLAKSNTGSLRFTDFPSLCACSESSLTNLIGPGLNLFCLQSHSKTECRWTRPEVAILGADPKERGLWGREWFVFCPELSVTENRKRPVLSLDWLFLI